MLRHRVLETGRGSGGGWVDINGFSLGNGDGNGDGSGFGGGGGYFYGRGDGHGFRSGYGSGYDITVFPESEDI